MRVSTLGMKFLKIGSKPDTFQSVGNSRSVVLGIDSDLTVVVDGVSFHLHKFPLSVKCVKIRKLVAERDGDNKREIELFDIPGGVEAFELCAKFCYGISITLSPYNAMAVRCAAEYLQMNEVIHKGNLIFKVEVFLNVHIYNRWKDSIIALDSTKFLVPWAMDLSLVNKCVDSIASKILADPSMVEWSFTPTEAISKDTGHTEITQEFCCNETQSKHQYVPDDWWIVDIADLEIDLFCLVLSAVDLRSGMPRKMLGKALYFYSHKWLPGVSKDYHIKGSMKRDDPESADDDVALAGRHCYLLEKIVTMLPGGKNCFPCSFFLKLIKAGISLGASDSTIMDLARRAGLQLDEASPDDLLIPSPLHASDMLYDVDLMKIILEFFFMQEEGSIRLASFTCSGKEQERKSAETVDSHESIIQSSKLQVAKTADVCLAEIARDANLPMSKFVMLATLIPENARPTHDELYQAIDIYIKEHPGLTKNERRNLCQLLDRRRLSMEACMHIAQNDRLPLRVIVQILFFEQVRSSMIGGAVNNPLNAVTPLMVGEGGERYSAEKRWDTVKEKIESIRGELMMMKIKISDAERERSLLEMEETKSAGSNINQQKVLCNLCPGESSSNSNNCC